MGVSLRLMCGSLCAFLAGKTWRESKESCVWIGEREGEIRLWAARARDAANELKPPNKPVNCDSESDLSEKLRERSRVGTRRSFFVSFSFTIRLSSAEEIELEIESRSCSSNSLLSDRVPSFGGLL